MFLINLSLVKDATADAVDRIAVKLINTLLICEADYCISAINHAREEIENILCIKCVDLVLCNDLNKLIAVVLSESIIGYFLTGIYSVGKVISEDVSESVVNLLRTPNAERVQDFKNKIKQLYSRDARKMGILIVSEMLKYQYEKDVDIEASTKNFFIKCGDQDVMDVINAVKGGGMK